MPKIAVTPQEQNSKIVLFLITVSGRGFGLPVLKMGEG